MLRIAGHLALGIVVVTALAACGDPAADAPSGSIVGPWQITAFADNGPLQPVLPGNSPTIEFLSDGSLAGFSGCNRFGASWTGGQSDLSITPLASTKMACVDEAAAAQEQSLLSAISSATGWQTSPEGADLLGPNGEPAVRLIPAQP
jgi:heat shock protein HslJ